MPFDTRTFRVLIASPSDVEEEREIAVRVIQEWNDLYSFTRRVVLLPLRWETHSAPEYGTRPQEVINRAIVDDCDLLVGVFWTRIGTPTGVAESGTIEEIKRVAKAGKPVMLYFSKVALDPDRVDLEQLARLKTFKEETFPQALTEAFKSQIEFRDKFARQLELKVRELQKADNPNQAPSLNLVFASPNLTELLPSPLVKTVTLTRLASDKELDGLTKAAATAVKSALEKRNNESRSLSAVLAISNTGALGIRNLYVEMSVRCTAGTATVSDISPRSKTSSFWSRLFSRELTVTTATSQSRIPLGDSIDTEIEASADGWKFNFEWVALQPQRVRLVKPELFIRPDSHSTIELTAKVYADSFPEPIILNSSLLVKVKEEFLTAAQLVPDLASLQVASESKEEEEGDSEGAPTPRETE